MSLMDCKCLKSKVVIHIDLLLKRTMEVNKMILFETLNDSNVDLNFIY